MNVARIALIMSVVAITLGVTALVVRAESAPDGPVPIVWDKAACAHCRMHVGDPHFAAQAQLVDGRVLDFDDPGCLMGWLDEHPKEALHAVWLRHSSEDVWIAREAAAFVPKPGSPMGFDVGAVRANESGATSWAIAKARSSKKGSVHAH